MKSKIHLKSLRSNPAPCISYGKGDNPTRGIKKARRIAKKSERILLDKMFSE